MKKGDLIFFLKTSKDNKSKHLSEGIYLGPYKIKNYSRVEYRYRSIVVRNDSIKIYKKKNNMEPIRSENNYLGNGIYHCKKENIMFDEKRNSYTFPVTRKLALERSK